MAAAFIHYFLGLGIACACGYCGLEALIVGLIGAVQDLDFLSFFFYKHMRSRYAKLFMHRGITHTFLFTFVCAAVFLVFDPVLSLIVLVNFLLHIFVDYVTAWGVSPFLPFSPRRYSLGLMTIFDIPLTVVSAGVGVSGFFSVGPVLPFVAFFGYILLRFFLKRRLKYDNLVPIGTFTYAFCFPEDDYTVGKITISGRKETISVQRTNSEIDPLILQKIHSEIDNSMLSHFLEYPVYSMENQSIMITDARSYLFPKSSRFFTIFFDIETEDLYMLVAGRRFKVN
jgi:membrane-bound metal-dependent hydrolase YbcI (DUF457 family)